MGAKLKKFNFWLRRKSHLPLLLVGSLVVMLLFFNEDVSMSLNMEYEKQINQLTLEIQECKDSAAFYRSQREALIHDSEDLERLARERFHMQRPTEDIYIIKQN